MAKRGSSRKSSGKKGKHHKSPKTLHFKNKKEYEKWLAYDHMHVKKHRKNPPEVYIHGKKHHVNHGKKKSR